MSKVSFNDAIEFDENRVKTKVIVESSFSKEIRILLKNGQMMKEHKTAHPIIIHVLKGCIDFGIHGENLFMKGGDIIHLEGDVPHDLKANEDSVIRLTLSKLDRVERVNELLDK